MEVPLAGPVLPRVALPRGDRDERPPAVGAAQETPRELPEPQLGVGALGLPFEALARPFDGLLRYPRGGDGDRYPLGLGLLADLLPLAVATAPEGHAHGSRLPAVVPPDSVGSGHVELPEHLRGNT